LTTIIKMENNINRSEYIIYYKGTYAALSLIS